jgi:hypothetical protein
VRRTPEIRCPIQDWYPPLALYQLSEGMSAPTASSSDQVAAHTGYVAGFQHAVLLADLAQRWEQFEDLASLLACIVGEGRSVLSADGVAVLRVQGGRWFTVAASDTVTRRAADVHASFKGLAKTRANRERADPDVEEFNVARRTRRHLRSEGNGRLSLLSLPLSHPTCLWGALNVYLRSDDNLESGQLVPLYAQHASVALTHIAEREALRHGVATQRRIGQAQGILMSKHSLSPDLAMERLVRLAKRTNVALPVAADQVVAAHQSSPTPPPTQSPAQTAAEASATAHADKGLVQVNGS